MDHINVMNHAIFVANIDNIINIMCKYPNIYENFILIPHDNYILSSCMILFYNHRAINIFEELSNLAFNFEEIINHIIGNYDIEFLQILIDECDIFRDEYLTTSALCTMLNTPDFNTEFIKSMFRRKMRHSVVVKNLIKIDNTDLIISFFESNTLEKNILDECTCEAYFDKLNSFEILIGQGGSISEILYLQKYIINGDLNNIKKILNESNIEFVYNSSDTTSIFLFLALEHDHIEIAKCLIQYGYEIDQLPHSALTKSCLCGFFKNHNFELLNFLNDNNITFTIFDLYNFASCNVKIFTDSILVDLYNYFVHFDKYVYDLMFFSTSCRYNLQLVKAQINCGIAESLVEIQQSYPNTLVMLIENAIEHSREMIELVLSIVEYCNDDTEIYCDKLYDLELLKELYGHGFNIINANNCVMALVDKKYDIVDFMLNNKLNINDIMIDAFANSINCFEKDQFQFLINSGCEIPPTILQGMALRRDKNDIFRYLYENIEHNNIDVNQIHGKLLGNCCIYYNNELIEFLLSKQNRNTTNDKIPIFNICCFTDNIEALRILRKYDYIDSYENGLFSACEQNNIRTVQFLLDNDMYYPKEIAELQQSDSFKNIKPEIIDILKTYELIF
jgi:hypothetical protein